MLAVNALIYAAHSSLESPVSSLTDPGPVGLNGSGDAELWGSVPNPHDGRPVCVAGKPDGIDLVVGVAASEVGKTIIGATADDVATTEVAVETDGAEADVAISAADDATADAWSGVLLLDEGSEVTTGEVAATVELGATGDDEATTFAVVAAEVTAATAVVDDPRSIWRAKVASKIEFP